MKNGLGNDKKSFLLMTAMANKLKNNMVYRITKENINIYL